MDDQRVKFKYLFDKDYDPEYINGIYGGINPCGELVLHFFLERIPLPYEESVNLNEDEETFGETSVTMLEEFKFIRSIKSGVVMNKDTAETLLEWLQNVVTEMEDNDG